MSQSALTLISCPPSNNARQTLTVFADEIKTVRETLDIYVFFLFFSFLPFFYSNAMAVQHLAFSRNPPSLICHRKSLELLRCRDTWISFLSNRPRVTKEWSKTDSTRTDRCRLHVRCGSNLLPVQTLSGPASLGPPLLASLAGPLSFPVPPLER